jgi:damage-control phosphatase, subfamily I
MKVTEACYSCLKGLVEKTVALSEGDGAVLSGCVGLLDRLWAGQGSPPAIANELLAHIKDVTGAYDPFAPIKEIELARAREAARKLEGLFGPTLEGAIMFSALGNSTDFFVEGGFNPEPFPFFGLMDKIVREIYIKSGEVLILGDNIGDFIFDVRLIRFLEGLGKRVFYAVREHPVQNDLSMKEVASFGFRELCDNIISTGSGEVGLREAHIKGAIKDLWEGDAVVIAKGMGNYETITEFNTNRPVIHIMKIKCPAVADDVHQSVGTYIAVPGGETNGK